MCAVRVPWLIMLLGPAEVHAEFPLSHGVQLARRQWPSLRY
jgi:hypothetical protein